jgi:hypothetical protein
MMSRETKTLVRTVAQGRLKRRDRGVPVFMPAISFRWSTHFRWPADATDFVGVVGLGSGAEEI